MIDATKYPEFDISEADIDKAIHILTVYNKKQATAEEAIEFLTWLRVNVHEDAKNMTTEELVAAYNKTAKTK